MCIIVGAELATLRIANTLIFAAAKADGRQSLVYSMNVAAVSDVAMILPVPVPPGADEDALRFISLEGYENFFEDVERAFPPLPAASGAVDLGASDHRATLKVHEVGDFIASFVPTRADFDRVDPTFRLSDSVWSALPDYSDYGFAVFQLKDLQQRPKGFWPRLLGRTLPATPKTIHPMAFEFPRREPEQLYFPTVHVHDGVVHETAKFDHTLFAQVPAGRAIDQTEWYPSFSPLGTFVDSNRAGDLIHPEAICCKRSIFGNHPNEDTLVPIA
jgi:hypothetical protein